MRFYNPLDWTRLLYWIFICPERLFHYPQKEHLYSTGRWASQAIVLLPLWILTGSAVFDKAFAFHVNKFIFVPSWWLIIPPLLFIANVYSFSDFKPLLIITHIATIVTLPLLLILLVGGVEIGFLVFFLTILSYLVLAACGVGLSMVFGYSPLTTWVSRLLYWGTLRRAGAFFALFEDVLTENDRRRENNGDSIFFFGLMVAAGVVFAGLYLFGGWRLLVE